MKNQEALLTLLSRMGSSGRAESERRDEFCRMFYAPREHMGALDPDVSLILGPRGSGKTALFRAVTEFDLSDTLRERNPKARIHQNCAWVAVKLYEKSYPDQTQLRTFFETQSLTEDASSGFWQCVLVRALWDQLDNRGKSECQAIRAAEATTADFLAVGQQFSPVAATALDRLDDNLEANGRILFVGFDELDLLVSRNGRAASTLVGFWASRWRRWKGIRAKLFVRSDIYRRFIVEGGADLAKLSANRFELKWTDESLLSMLVKRVINSDSTLWSKTLGLKKRDLVEDPRLGLSLQSDSVEALYQVVHAIVGDYMGAGPKKGATETWVLGHIKDCLGNASPRSLVRMFELAAEKQIADKYETDAVILAPTYLRQALTTVSADHVRSSMDEWPWLVGLQERLAKWTNLRQVPMERKPLEIQLRKTWGDRWDPILNEPPCDDPLEFVPMLIEIGLLKERKDGRLETTDLYLDGLGFKRKGGVRRKVLGPAKRHVGS
ncbi:MAG TPA: hypothetical protein VKP30_08845 [Polyangiaceae bacterium]|nr:hypothetical protein [Polyangiaceae bacterium]